MDPHESPWRFPMDIHGHSVKTPCSLHRKLNGEPLDIDQHGNGDSFRWTSMKLYGDTWIS